MAAPSAINATRDLLAKLWEKNRPIVEQRLATLESTARAAHSGTLSDELRQQAIADVHKLSGSLGMFGYPQATDLAREIEATLEAPDALDPIHLGAMVANLHAVLFPSS